VFQELNRSLPGRCAASPEHANAAGETPPNYNSRICSLIKNVQLGS